MFKVSIGLPVYNGEDYLEEALDSILSQDFNDFELLISDNASNDRTHEICQDYASDDRRIRYHRNENNLGAAPNFNQLFKMSKGKYFKWSSHDDLLHKKFLSECVKILDLDDQIVLCFSKAKCIDKYGQFIFNFDYASDYGSGSLCDRFYGQVIYLHPCLHVFGLMRSKMLAQTYLIGPFSASDRVLLAQLALLGEFYIVDEYLFFKRKHDNNSIKQYPSRRSRLFWFDTSKKNRIYFPEWKLLFQYYSTVMRSKLPYTYKLECLCIVSRYAYIKKKRLIKDLFLKK